MKIKWWHIGLLIALLVVLFAPLASSSPDGLEKVAEDKGFIDAAQGSPYWIVPDYVFPGIHNEAAATIVAGIIGTLVVFLIAWSIGELLKRKQRGAD